MPRVPVDRVPLAVGNRVRFVDGGRPFRVRAVSPDGRWAIVTKPFNARHTVLYTIVDFDGGVRGPDNRVFSRGYETDDDIAANMADLVAGDLEVSYRRDVRLAIAEVIRP